MLGVWGTNGTSIQYYLYTLPVTHSNPYTYTTEL